MTEQNGATDQDDRSSLLSRTKAEEEYLPKHQKFCEIPFILILKPGKRTLITSLVVAVVKFTELRLDFGAAEYI